MATKNEKLLASALEAILAEMRSNGFDLSERITAIEPTIKAILEEEESSDKGVGKKADERYYYTGCEFVTMPLEKRREFGVCEFTVTYQGKMILQMFWDVTLNWIMQPSEDGESFQPVMQRKFPGEAYARSFLKKLADEEREKPGSFAAKYYVQRPTAFVRKKATEPVSETVSE